MMVTISIMVTLVMGNQEICMMWKILKIIKMLMRAFYLISPPLVMVKIFLMAKITNLLWNEVTSKISINNLQ